MKSGLNSHYDFVHGEKNAKCDFCEKYFKTEENLSKHIIAIYEKCQDFKCHLCGKGFAFQLYLDTYIKNTHGEKKYSCDFCGKSCARAGDLKKYIKCVHEGQTDDYKCDSCGKFSIQATLLYIGIGIIGIVIGRYEKFHIGIL